MRKKSDDQTAARTGFIIAIDGPAGAGKSTVSQKLADLLGGLLLDTGGMYRGVALHTIAERLTQPKDWVQVAGRLKFDVDPDSHDLLIDGVALGNKLRTMEVSEAASKISSNKQVREILTRRQRTLARKWAKKVPVVVEGRDIGTVVFPNVSFKFYVTADAVTRAKRRLRQLNKQGVRKPTLEEILNQNAQRDRQDTSRKVAPLRCAKDAVVVDTSSMRIGQVVRFMADHIRGHTALML